MIEIADTQAIRENYLRQLNIAFPGWGGDAMFDWCFLRRTGCHMADLLVVRDATGALIAGSALTYRRVHRSITGRDVVVACMTGSWTVPEARGQGLFGAMIEASQHRAIERDCSFVIAFVDMTNPSAQRLRAAGATCHATSYITATKQLGNCQFQPTPTKLEDYLAAVMRRRSPEQISHFTYSRTDLSGQFLERPYEVMALRLPNDSFALIERRNNSDRLLDISTTDPRQTIEIMGAIANWSSHQKRAFTGWVLEPLPSTDQWGSGFDRKEGGFCLLPANEEPNRTERWQICNADRM